MPDRKKTDSWSRKVTTVASWNSLKLPMRYSHVESRADRGAAIVVEVLCSPPAGDDEEMDEEDFFSRSV
jgi:hypothetical protein